MELTLKGLQDNLEAYITAGYYLPEFDYRAVLEKTIKEPAWIHFGAGNIFRAFTANVVQKLLNKGVLDKGLIVAEGFDYDIIEKINRPHDNLSVLVTLKADNTIEKTVVGSIMESLLLDRTQTEDFNRLEEIFSSPSLQMVSFTITEKGYALTDGKGNIHAAIKSDLSNIPEAACSYLGKVASLLYTRYKNGRLPIAMVSMDNCSHNGDILSKAIHKFARDWCDAGLADMGFWDYVSDPETVSFPWSMIDKITPRPDARIEALLRKDNLAGVDTVITSKNTYVAPFVNAEECEYLVIEDSFPNGRPPLEQGGILFTDRETVDKVEKMKVCTCLNPLHTTLAIFGCLLGYEFISEEMKNPLLKKLVEYVGYEEGLPVVVHPGILNPIKFIDEVVNIRIPNPFLPDTPWRIATDTSQKLAIRFGETIRSYETREDLEPGELKYIPLILAGWLRYLMGIDDAGNPYTLSPDPLLDTVTPLLANYRLSNEPKDLDPLDTLLHNKEIFGADLDAAGLIPRIKKYFLELSAGTGAVAKTLEKYIVMR